MGTLTAHYDMLLTLNGWSELKSKKLIDQLTKPLEVTMTKFLVALSLNNVGPDTASKLALIYPTLDAIINDQPVLTLEKWHEQVGNISEEPIAQLLQQKPLIKKLAPHIEIINQKVILSTLSLDGFKFVITGKSEKISRNDLIDKITANGGVFQKAISSKTSYLIDLSENTNSSKSKKAEKLGVSVISLDEFNQLISV